VHKNYAGRVESIKIIDDAALQKNGYKNGVSRGTSGFEKRNII
jgi:hypothetical protein